MTDTGYLYQSLGDESSISRQDLLRKTQGCAFHFNHLRKYIQ